MRIVALSNKNKALYSTHIEEKRTETINWDDPSP